jgi:RNA polymerase sigma-70 factor (ECF subfamily)
MKKEKIEILFRQHYGPMIRLAKRMLYDDEESLDVVSEVFATLIKTDIAPRNMESYLMKSVRNRCLNVIRGRKIQERVQRLYLFDIDTSVIPPDLFREEAKALSEGISLLSPPVCREVVELHFRDGLTFREVALRLGVSETTVYKHLRHALQQLREHLKRKLV